MFIFFNETSFFLSSAADDTAVVGTQWAPKWMIGSVKETGTEQILWAKYFVAVDEGGNLKLFEDETMDPEKLRASFNLKRDTVTLSATAPQPDFTLFRQRMQSQDQDIEFLFEDFEDLHEFMRFVERFVNESMTKGNGM